MCSSCSKNKLWLCSRIDTDAGDTFEDWVDQEKNTEVLGSIFCLKVVCDVAHEMQQPPGLAYFTILINAEAVLSLDSVNRLCK